MKYKSFGIIAVFCCTINLTAVAEVVEPQQAMQVAERFMQPSKPTKKNAKTSSASTSEIVYTHYMPQSGKPAIYVVNIGDAFALVSADDVAHPILGYNYSKSWPKDGNLPPQVKSFLDDLAAQMEAASGTTPDSEILAEWQQPKTISRRTVRKASDNLPDSVGPLLTTTWDQGQYYNAMCPEDQNGPDGHVWAGCVATAMAQIIKYWENPLQGRGVHTYKNRYGTVSVNYDTTTYHFANMPNMLTSTSSETEVNAVAGLIRDCGVAVNMDYQTNNSKALSTDIRAALVSQFLYNPNMFYADRALYGFSEWILILKKELAERRPVIYGGASDNNAHEFICDGYKMNNFFHFNFGWGGQGDGWYLSSAINTGMYKYNSNQHIIAGIQPIQSSELLYSRVGAIQGSVTEYVVDSTIHFASEMFQNSGRSSAGGGNLQNMVTFVSANSSQQLVLDILAFDGQTVAIYDGSPTNGEMPDSLLIHSYEDGATTFDQTSILSTHGVLTLNILNMYKKKQGFCFRISLDNINHCRMVSNIVANVKETTVRLDWHENGAAAEWEVEYGLKNFELGTGTRTLVSDTTITLQDLISFKEYDVYVRPVCELENGSLWRKVTVMPSAKSWTDIVTSRPAGYTEDEAGVVYISSAEGLAWLAKQSKGQPFYFYGKKAVLTEDINLGQYNWSGMSMFRGYFDGQGHTVDSMLSTNSGSLFGELAQARVKNLNLTNCYTNGSGGLANDVALDDTIMNCFVSGVIKGGAYSDVGGIIGDARQGADAYILNCVANCELSGGSYVGGIAGVGSIGNGNQRHLIIKNCYSSGSIRGNLLLGYAEYATLENCYANTASAVESVFLVGKGKGTTCRDLTLFTESENGFELHDSIFFEIDSTYYKNLKDALNAGVRKLNIPGLRMWVDDTTDVNNGMPIIGEEYLITCPSVKSLSARNIAVNSNIYGLRVSWAEKGDASEWMVECIDVSNPDTLRYYTQNNPDTIYGLVEGHSYNLRVYPRCGEHNRGAWCDAITTVYDRPYWRNMVTKKPVGYELDSLGNAYISTAEALVWFAKRASSFKGKTVILTSDVNLEQYKWTAINNFLGTFDGGGHTITGLYVNETSNYQGMFGQVSGGTYKNIYFDKAYVKGGEKVGILLGFASEKATIINCHTNGDVYGETYVGGMVGQLWNSYGIDRCSSSGTVTTSYDYIGGLVGEVGGCVKLGDDDFEYPHIRNSYSTCLVKSARYGAGGIIGTGEYILENCYATGDVINGFMYNGGIVGSIHQTTSYMRNCYGAGNVQRTGLTYANGANYGYRFGALAGTTAKVPNIMNCYGMEDAGFPMLIGISDDGTSPVVSDNALFVVRNNTIALKDTIMVGSEPYHDLLSALNAWVDANDSNNVFLHWETDTANVNGGFPIFAMPKLCKWLTESNNTEWGETRTGFTQSTYRAGTILSAEAIPNEGYQFVKWNDGKTINPYVLNIMEDTYLLAVFAPNNTMPDETQVFPTTTTATFTWPLIVNGYTYTLTVYLDADMTVPFCNILFDESGHFVSRTFYKSAIRKAVQEDGAFTYTITDLQPETQYYFQMKATDIQDHLLNTDIGSFTTKNTPTSIENQQSEIKNQKLMKNGILYIERNGKIYTTTGQEVK